MLKGTHLDIVSHWRSQSEEHVHSTEFRLHIAHIRVYEGPSGPVYFLARYRPQEKGNRTTGSVISFADSSSDASPTRKLLKTKPQHDRYKHGYRATTAKQQQQREVNNNYVNIWDVRMVTSHNMLIHMVF